VLAVRKSRTEKEIPVDVGPALIRAGKGGATFADIQVGDRVEAYGEVTIQGGLRAIELSLPKERMSIAPKSKRREQPPKEPAAAAEKSG